MTSSVSQLVQRIVSLESRLASLQGPAATPSEALAGRGVSFAQALAGAQHADSGRGASDSQPARPYDALVQAAALRHGVDPDLVHAVMRAESNYNPRCVSHAGAMRLMQLMPATARSQGLTDPFDPAQNIEGGVRVLAGNLARFPSLDLALAAYNAGPGAVRRYGGVPPYRETQTYLQRVQRYLSEIKQGDR